MGNLHFIAIALDMIPLSLVSVSKFNHALCLVITLLDRWRLRSTVVQAVIAADRSSVRSAVVKIMFALFGPAALSNDRREKRKLQPGRSNTAKGNYF